MEKRLGGLGRRYVEGVHRRGGTAERVETALAARKAAAAGARSGDERCDAANGGGAGGE